MVLDTCSAPFSEALVFVKAATDASYLWLKLKDVVLGCPEVYLYVPSHVAKTEFEQDQTYSRSHQCMSVCPTPL